jgi:hypothetical protein
MGRSKVIERKKLRYKKIGGGSARLVLNGRRQIIKPNEKFSAYPEEISESFKDVIICLEEEAVVEKKQAQAPVVKLFGVKKRPKTDGDEDPGKDKKGKVKSWYNVVNKDNKKVMNPNALTQANAKTLAKSLNK